MSVPAFIYGREAWMLSNKDTNKVYGTKMKFLINGMGCTRLKMIRNA